MGRSCSIGARGRAFAKDTFLAARRRSSWMLPTDGNAIRDAAEERVDRSWSSCFAEFFPISLDFAKRKHQLELLYDWVGTKNVPPQPLLNSAKMFREQRLPAAEPDNVSRSRRRLSTPNLSLLGDSSLVAATVKI